jgi:hypothetical protein
MLGDIGDLLVVDLLGTFGVERREEFDSWRIVFEERFVEVCM